MNAYTVSRLALNAGVSVHIVRDYLLRGLLRPVACTPGGYGLFDDAALQRLCPCRRAFRNNGVHVFFHAVPLLVSQASMMPMAGRRRDRRSAVPGVGKTPARLRRVALPGGA